MKTHDEKTLKCSFCEKTFTLKQNLASHTKIHLYPKVRLFRHEEARLKSSAEADKVAKQPKQKDERWPDLKTAKSAARKLGHKLWRARVVSRLASMPAKHLSGYLKTMLAGLCGCFTNFTGREKSARI